MARWQRGPFKSLTELHDSLIETLLEGADSFPPNRTQLIKIEMPSDEKRTTVITRTGVIEGFNLTQMADKRETLAIIYGYEDSLWLDSNSAFIPGIKYWQEV